ncbi:hypothetical protein LX99_00532 [Mucilaginibacter oryzae]|uniref:Uncharacterized protein n=1 Tax=Mucilaginibacter oryzae TaxID=468058 RepID=A0A316HHG0_9SPHI|nr:DUF6756 family protein [Mucilaginibacter oryzae]PWK80068.1 hypothetical protein LX99_00532 [Mucilaginibacter oryzae]
MGEVAREIEDAIAILNLSADIVSKIDYQHNEALYYELLAYFVDGRDRRWWWEAFKSSFSFNDFEYPPDHLKRIIPNLERKVWLMIEDVQEKFYPIYDVDPNYIPDILNNCFHFEYYIIDKDYDWLLCENHHRHVIGVGAVLKLHNLHLIS